MKSYFLILTIFSTWITLLIIFHSSFKDVINTNAIISTGKDLLKAGVVKVAKPNGKENSLKYILQWTSDSNVPFVYMGKGRQVFIEKDCRYTNCFVTSNRSYLGDYTKFDVIAISGPELLQVVYDINLPKRRAVHQKYVFVSIESSNWYPVCTNEYDGVFNWTWTYKLDSEVHWGYVVIRDMENNIIGPKKDMTWLKLEEMDPVSDDFKNKLRSKRKAAAWFVSNCESKSKRENFAKNLQLELSEYGHDLDIYGTCGKLICSRDHDDDCDRNLEITYYFYLSFENAFSEDYVTEKLLRPLKNNAVPIVYGGANYTRFMPDGAYLNARDLGFVKLAAKMNELINDLDKYAEYFKWKNHYWYHKTTESIETNEYCRICELLNDDKAVKETTVYKKFSVWWDPPNIC